tara:strand:+ start:872 stop:1525 length:654 start_codon:yes stop_codon:yes gene_type:complete
MMDIVCAASFVRDSPHLTNVHPELKQRINDLLDRIDEQYSKEELDDLFEEFNNEVLDANIAKTREEGLSPFDLEVNLYSIQFSTVMNGFQATKLLYSQDVRNDLNLLANFDYSSMEKFKDLEPIEANREGRRIHLDIEAWDKDKRFLMKDMLKKVFDQDEDAKDRLKNTGDREIQDNSMPDPYWGKSGENIYGKILTEIRDSWKATATVPKKKKRSM